MERGEADVGDFFFTERVACVGTLFVSADVRVGMADADAPPTTENVNPAAPNAGAAALATRSVCLKLALPEA